MLLKKVLSFAVPASIALAAFLHARAIGSLIDATALSSVSPLGAPAASIAPFAEARAAESESSTTKKAKSADAILDRNPFDHVTGPLRHLDGEVVTTAEIAETNPFAAPPCDGVRAVASVRATEQAASFAALDLGGGKHVLRGRGGDVGEMRVVYVAEDRVWLSRDGVLCQAKVFGSPPVVVSASLSAATPPPTGGGAPTKLESEISKKIVKTGPTSYEIDRGAVSQILEAQTELMKVPLIPEKENGNVVGFKMVKIKEGSVLSALGLLSGDRLVSLNGIEVTSTERMVEAYARLRSGTLERFSINVVRNGKPTNLDYVIK